MDKCHGAAGGGTAHSLNVWSRLALMAQRPSSEITALAMERVRG
jgi:hypothetical protein